MMPADIAATRALIRGIGSSNHPEPLAIRRFADRLAEGGLGPARPGSPEEAAEILAGAILADAEGATPGAIAAHADAQRRLAEGRAARLAADADRLRAAASLWSATARLLAARADDPTTTTDPEGPRR